jgi:competence protein ComEA
MIRYGGSMKKQKLIGSAVILVVAAIFLLIGYYKSRPVKTDYKEVYVEEGATLGKSSKQMKVYITGAIAKPGVYSLNEGSRVEDIIKIAGGLLANADTGNINLAETLKDGRKIVIPEKKEIPNTSVVPTGAGAVAPAPTSTSTSTVSSKNSEGKFNVNTATEEELKTVPGIGDATAKKIIDFREKSGDFSIFEDLKKIGRVGDKTIEKWKEYLDVW